MTEQKADFLHNEYTTVQNDAFWEKCKQPCNTVAEVFFLNHMLS